MAITTTTMTTSQYDSAALVGRILLAALFIMSGFGKIGGFEGTTGYIASKGLPLPQLLTALTILVELGGGRAATFPALVPVFGVIIGYLALGVVPSLAQFVGMLIVLVGFHFALRR